MRRVLTFLVQPLRRLILTLGRREKCVILGTLESMAVSKAQYIHHGILEPPINPNYKAVISYLSY